MVSAFRFLAAQGDEFNVEDLDWIVRSFRGKLTSEIVFTLEMLAEAPVRKPEVRKDTG